MNRVPRLAAIGLCALLATPVARPDGSDPRPAELDPLVRLIAGSDDPGFQRDLLAGALAALDGRRILAMPASWPVASAKLLKSPDRPVRDLATRLALLFGDPAAFDALRTQARDPAEAQAARVDAIEALARARDPRLAPTLLPLLADPAVRAASLRALASTESNETAPLILQSYPSFSVAEKGDAITTLAARPASALALLDAIAKGAIPRPDVPAAALQTLAGHTDPRVKDALAAVWGAVRGNTADKLATIARLKAELTTASLARADRVRGRLLFDRACATCHTLFNVGGKVGPELTGAQRTNLDYVLSNVVDPSAVVGRDYQAHVFATTDGRIVSGIIRREDDRTVAVQTANDLILLPKPEIEARRMTGESIMPEGLLNPLTKDEIRDLVGYLGSPAQVPLPKNPS